MLFPRTFPKQELYCPDFLFVLDDCCDSPTLPAAKRSSVEKNFWLMVSWSPFLPSRRPSLFFLRCFLSRGLLPGPVVEDEIKTFAGFFFSAAWLFSGFSCLWWKASFFLCPPVERIAHSFAFDLLLYPSFSPRFFFPVSLFCASCVRLGSYNRERLFSPGSFLSADYFLLSFFWCGGSPSVIGRVLAHLCRGGLPGTPRIRVGFYWLNFRARCRGPSSNLFFYFLRGEGSLHVVEFGQASEMVFPSPSLFFVERVPFPSKVFDGTLFPFKASFFPLGTPPPPAYEVFSIRTATWSFGRLAISRNFSCHPLPFSLPFLLAHPAGESSHLFNYTPCPRG